MNCDSDFQAIIERAVDETLECLGEEQVERLIECSIEGEGFVEVEVEGLRLTIPCSDMPEAWLNLSHIFCTHDYGRIEGFEPGRDWVIVDGGAYIGFYTVYAASRAARGLVVAVEPIPRNRAILESNIISNRLENIVRIDPRALWKEQGFARMTLSCYPATSSLYREHVEKLGDVCGSVNVATVTLPSLLDDHKLEKVDVLKLDVEGAELDVLGVKGWEERVERLVVEVHKWVVEPAEIAKLLERRGFRTRVVDIGSESQVILYAWRL